MHIPAHIHTHHPSISARAALFPLGAAAVYRPLRQQEMHNEMGMISVGAERHWLLLLLLLLLQPTSAFNYQDCGKGSLDSHLTHT